MILFSKFGKVVYEYVMAFNNFGFTAHLSVQVRWCPFSGSVLRMQALDFSILNVVSAHRKDGRSWRDQWNGNADDEFDVNSTDLDLILEQTGSDLNTGKITVAIMKEVKSKYLYESYI